MKKRILSLLLSLALCLGLSVNTLAASNDFIIQDGVLKGYRGTAVDVVIPDGVTSIDRAFISNKDIRSVVIPSSMTKIDDKAFSGCTGLTSVTIPNSVTEIGKEAFRACPSLTSVTIPGSVTSIQRAAFDGCTGLTSVTIPESVTSIRGETFQGCTGLTNVTIPNSVTYIGDSAFLRCTSLTSVTIPDSVTYIGSWAFDSCTGLTSATIPDSVTEIGGSAFEGCTGLTSVDIPDGVTSIGREVFGGCTGLTSVTIPDSVTEIGFYAFKNCTSLTSLTIPSSVTDIYDNAFWGCENLTIYGEANSYADLYAYRNGIPFVVGQAPGAPAANTAYPSTQSVNVDGKAVTFECYALKEGNGMTNYIKLRDLALLLSGTAAQFSVGWDGSVTITTNTAYTPNGSELSTPFSGERTYQQANAATKVNGQAVDLAAFVLNDDQGGGYTYYQLRDVGKALGFNVGWSGDRGIFIETNKPYDPNN